MIARKKRQPNRRQRPYRSLHRPRGMVLLVVVSLITLFLLIGITFTVLAMNYRDAAVRTSQMDLLGDNYEHELDNVFRLLLRDSKSPPLGTNTNPTVVRGCLTWHSLLMDLYGVDGVAGRITADSDSTQMTSGVRVENPTNNTPNGQIIHFTAQVTAPPIPYKQGPFSQIPDYYTGRVLTFVDGDAAGLSTRVMKYEVEYVNPMSGPKSIHHFWVTTFDASSDSPNVRTPGANSRFLVNGAPFNGTGFGYTTKGNAYNLDQTVRFSSVRQTLDSTQVDEGKANVPVALLPNYWGYPSLGLIQEATSADQIPLLGGPDEGYDAPTLQDVLLALIPVDPTQSGARTIPSLHRPDMINFLANSATVAWAPQTGYRDIRRSAIFRPMPWDHKNFTGSNPAFQGADKWEVGPDMRPGIKDIDDDNNGTADDNSELGWPTSDDHLANDSQTYPAGPNPSYPNLANSVVNGPWDVDNDGDGVADSVWIDPGLPVMVAPSGRKYKRLFAIQVRDLDGKININAAGNLALSTAAGAGTANYNRAATQVAPYFMPMAGTHSNLPSNLPTNAPPATIALPRGLGFGPAEMDFAHIFNNDLTTYTNLLYGRYGTDKRPGVANLDDPQSTNKAFSHLGGSLGSSSPPDVWGRGIFGLSFLGQPLYLPVSYQAVTSPYMQSPAPGGYFTANHNIGTAEFQDDAYEAGTDPRRARTDTPYTAGDLEHLLRYRDGDTSSTRRKITELTGNYLSTDALAQIRRQTLTTVSSHLPVPRTVPIGTMRDRGLMSVLNAGTSTILDVFAGKLVTGSNPVLNFKREVAWELRQGRLFNLNRPFGNGIHDDQPGSAVNFYGVNIQTTWDPYGVVDDPSEFFLGYSSANPPQSGQMNPNSAEKVLINGQGVPMWHRGDEPMPPTWPPPGGFSVSSADPRQLYCRHLYCLLWYLLPEKVDFDDDGNDDLANAAGRIKVARRLAQWVVNVVDFRDPDSINTAFEYDENPLDGWDVDGDLTTEEGGTNSTNRGIVWGMERPEMLLTETIAFHDRRTEDLEDPDKKVDATTDPDEDYDSHYRPQAGTFIELYNPWHSYGNQEKLPPELYANGGIALNRKAPDGTPVWRMIVVAGESHANQTEPDGETFKTNPGMGMGMGMGLGKKKPQSLPAGDVVRSVYFTNPVGYVNAAIAHPKMGDPKHGKAYYKNDSLPIAPLLPGRYAVVGSSNWDRGDMSQHVFTTYMGRLQNAVIADPSEARRIELRPNANPNVSQVVFANNYAPNNDEVVTADVAPPIAVAINTRASDNAEMSFSLTEPYAGYPAETTPPHVWTVPPSDGASDVPGDYEKPYDDPLDSPEMRSDQEPDASGNNVDWWEILKNDQTAANFRTIYLQRLANPLLPWDPDTNPYLTVDGTSVDLTCYNGFAADSSDPENMPQTVNFQSFQRGGSYQDPTNTYNVPNIDGSNVDANRKLWKRQAARGAITSASPTEVGFTDQHFFPYPAFSTLGYLNSRYYPYFKGSEVGGATADFAGAPMPRTYGATLATPRNGTSDDAFPWLAFLNRPFMNPAEILLVPDSSSSQFTRGYELDNSESPYRKYAKPFAFLLNPFHSDDVGAGTEGATFCRLFDYVETANPYVDQESYFNPASGNMASNTHFGGTATTLGMPMSVPVVKHDGDYLMAQGYANFSAANGYRPPFNFLSRYREPGRINLNTMFDEYTGGRNLVFESITKQVPGLDDQASGFRDRIYASRRGPLESEARYNLNPNSPMVIGNPYRAADLHNIMPNATAGGSKLRKDTPIEATLFRPDPNTAAPNRLPLVRDTSSYASQAYMHVARNPYFAYQPLGKMMNMVTTNSNCYAIWITVGYFEAEEVGAPSYIYPDGYRLGMEIGADSGETKRHRSFYIIDRSIPVGFEPGEDHNVDKCVLLRRVIE